VNLLQLVFKEILRRKTGFLLACAAVAFAAAGVVFSETISKALQDAMRRVTKNLGTNILVLPSNIDANAFWAGQDGRRLMDQSLVTKLAESKIPADHFIGKVQQLISVDGNRAVLTGTMVEVGNVGRRKPWKKPMIAAVDPGKCVLGSAIAETLGKADGDFLTILGLKLQVHKVERSKGPIEDVRIFIAISEARQLMKIPPGKIHAIDALGCICAIGEYGPQTFPQIEQQIEKLLVEDNQTYAATTYTSIASTRMEARLATELTRQITVGVLSTLALLVVAFYMLSDVKARREELGMFLACGFGPGRLLFLLIGKLLLVAVIGAIIGFGAGTLAATDIIDPQIYAKFALRPKPDWMLFLWTLVGTTGVSLIAGVIPALLAVATDPAEVLRKN
jgi:putative ABC transport system permease protein